MNAMDNGERIILNRTIRNLEDTLNAACEMNGELRESVNYLGNENDELKRDIMERVESSSFRLKQIRALKEENASLGEAIVKLINEKVAAENEARELRYEIIQKDEEIERAKWLAFKAMNKSTRRAEIIQLLKRQRTRLQKKIQTMTDIAAMWEEVAMWHKRDAANARAEINSLKAQLENARGIITTDAQKLPGDDFCEVEYDYREMDSYGFAPCGNGCPVKRNASGGLFDDHEITCEENPEYVGLWLN